MSWYVNCLKKYAVFEGRARRKEYWMFALFYVIFAIVASTIDSLIFKSETFGILYSVYFLATLIPAIAVIIRRLHDTGRSGWNYLLALVPIVGGIIVFVYMIQDSNPGENKYGKNPKSENNFTPSGEISQSEPQKMNFEKPSNMDW
jgi:uncharacterized membrane protein YhaH (DUF805 family)